MTSKKEFLGKVLTDRQEETFASWFIWLKVKVKFLLAKLNESYFAKSACKQKQLMISKRFTKKSCSVLFFYWRAIDQQTELRQPFKHTVVGRVSAIKAERKRPSFMALKAKYRTKLLASQRRKDKTVCNREAEEKYLQLPLHFYH